MVDKSNSSSEDETLKEIRKDRKIMCRKILLKSSSEKQDEKEVMAKVLFIHGSCGASSQFDELLDSMSTLLKSKKGTAIQCHLFDAYGCGKSRVAKFKSKMYSSVSEEELAKDLETIARSVISPEEEDTDSDVPMFLVAHSYGASQAIKLYNTLNDSGNAKCIKGMMLLGGALEGGPSSNARSGGPGIFKRTPLFMLKRLQSKMNHAFVKKAFHEKSSEELKESSLSLCKQNKMTFVRAFNRQMKWANESEAKQVQVKVIVVHGKEDNIFPLSSGEHLNECFSDSELSVIPDASHQVFQEQPDKVAELLWDFMEEQLNIK